MGTKTAMMATGDCRELLRTIPPNSIDLVVTSPPYDDLRNYKGAVGAWGWDTFSEVATELYRVLTPGGVIVWVVGDATVSGSETGSSFKQALYFMGLGLRLHDTMIYLKDNPAPVGGSTRYYQAFEYMFVLSKGSPRVFNALTRPRKNKYNDKRTVRYRAVTRDKDGEFTKKVVPIKTVVKRENVWSYVVGGGNSTSDKIAFRHPAIFPEKLAEDHILTWSDPGDMVLDPFAGSGTTGKVALHNGRSFVGIEVVEEYADIARERMGIPRGNQGGVPWL